MADNAGALPVPPTAPPSPAAETHSGDGASSGGGLSQLALALLGGGGGAAASAPVPDVLLSLAKDDRYISAVASLLSQVAVSFASVFLLPRRIGEGRERSGAPSPANAHNGEDILEEGGQRFIERLRPELNLLAAIIVHSATFVFYTRNVGGIVGANNGDSIQRSLGMESLNLAYQYPVKKRGNPSVSSESIKRLRESLIISLSSLEISRWHRLLLLQTIVPYIIHRVGRGGWSKDLGGLFSTLLNQCGLGSIIRTGGGRGRTVGDGHVNQQSRDDEDTAVRNDDRLRGSARRRLFEEQRRRMLSLSGGASHSGTGSNVDDDSEAVDETAIGTRHETMNGSYLNRASASIASGNSALDRRLQNLLTFTRNALRRFFLASSTLSHGAHTLPRHISASTSESLDRYAKTIKWFLRLHLALFYWNGTYPTVAHRLARAKIRDGVSPYSSSESGAVIANRPSYKPLAALILFQAGAALAQTTAEASIEVAHFIQVSFFRWRRRRRMQQQSQSNGSIFAEEHRSAMNGTSSERSEYMDLIEERVPGIASAKKDAPKSTDKARRRKQKHKSHEGSDAHPCGICLNERVDSAAPSGCGHVFCWNCILHWVSNVRAECPLCRAKARPQDILPLCNYP